MPNSAWESSDSLEEITCANCGAAIRPGDVLDGVALCKYCGINFRVPLDLAPEPAMGDLLLGADFRDPDLRGWKMFNNDKWELRPGPRGELWAKFPASNLIHPVLRTPGPLDDFDLSVNIRFVDGVFDYVSAGMEVRTCDDGDYIVQISAQGTFRVGWHNKTEWGGEFFKWADHPALRKGMNQDNRMRVIARGDLLRVYLNGVVATSVHDSKYAFGYARLVVSPGDKVEPATVAFSDLQLRETKPR